MQLALTTYSQTRTKSNENSHRSAQQGANYICLVCLYEVYAFAFVLFIVYLYGLT